MRIGYVYMMSNKPNGTIYTGVTSSLSQRVRQHQSGTGSIFCRKYGLKRLVYAEQHDSIGDAIAREKAIKAWQRAWKCELIYSVNPDWNDLSNDPNWLS